MTQESPEKPLTGPATVKLAPMDEAERPAGEGATRFVGEGDSLLAASA